MSFILSPKSSSPLPPHCLLIISITSSCSVSVTLTVMRLYSSSEVSNRVITIIQAAVDVDLVAIRKFRPAGGHHPRMLQYPSQTVHHEGQTIFLPPCCGHPEHVAVWYQRKAVDVRSFWRATLINQTALFAYDCAVIVSGPPKESDTPMTHEFLNSVVVLVLFPHHGAISLPVELGKFLA
ncbi:hypothetical protein NA57DRAFT_53119 [Rhizodiscina lignyota]|uniref:Uncharacterized protein n=1 Tax=Rhizodiscina lignyota TaxID=1504668 RepID=A0A9P4IM12_9PEZI|nr:hypothetical protein NA57DRAFT_53119 [Rhizodiscina lignyota]